MTHEDWMRQALELARRAGEKDEVPVGALLVADGKLLGAGQNEREQTSRTVAHAEIRALEGYNATYRSWRVPPGTALYVTTEPCLMCTGALIWARVQAIYYGCDDPRGAGIRTQRELLDKGTFDHRFGVVAGGILADECAELLKAFFRKKRGH